MSTLTDRYVAAVGRGVHEKQRTDVENELRASLADAIDDRLAGGASAAVAERDAIAELGDPMVLAAHYTDRPLHLIGPALYPGWKRTVYALEIITVPVVLVVLLIVGLATGKSVGDAIGWTVWITLTVAMQLLFWITVMFAIAERTPSMTKSPVEWTPEMLVEAAPSESMTWGGFLCGASLWALVTIAFVASPLVTPLTDAHGAGIPFFNPWIWETGLIVVLAVVPLLQIGVGAVTLRWRWTRAFTIGAIALDVVLGGILAALAATDQLLNPAFAEAAGWPDFVTPIVRWGVLGLVAIALLLGIADHVRSMRQSAVGGGRVA